MDCVKVKTELMSEEFPSIWIELSDQHSKKLLIGGFYKELTRDGRGNEEDQITRMKVFTEQIEAASKIAKKSLGIGGIKEFEAYDGF